MSKGRHQIRKYYFALDELVNGQPILASDET